MSREVTSPDFCLKRSPMAAVLEIEQREARVDGGGVSWEFIAITCLRGAGGSDQGSRTECWVVARI